MCVYDAEMSRRREECVYIKKIDKRVDTKIDGVCCVGEAAGVESVGVHDRKRHSTADGDGVL